MPQEKETEVYNHNQIVQWIEQKFKDEKDKHVYRFFEESPEFASDIANIKKKQEFVIFPSLSVDLIVVEPRPELIDIDEGRSEGLEGGKKGIFNYYYLFFAISTEKVIVENINDLKQRLMFYLFHLSRVSEQKRVRIIVVIPHYINVPPNFLEFCKETGFGLWKIKIEEKNEQEICKPKSLRERMEEEFKISLDKPKQLGETLKKISSKVSLKDTSKLNQATKELAEDYAIFFDQYILEAVDAISGITPERYGKRYIDRVLLSYVFDLSNISYKKKLCELVNEHLDENKDDYEFVAEVFSALWEDYVGISYSKFLETFEPALLHVFAEGEERGRIYRDHYIHQFQVFLLGAYIIDKLYADFEKYNCPKPEINWLITSSFHDMAYPVQLYDDWSKGFFQKVFNVDIKLANIDLKTSFIDQSFLVCMGYLICSLCCVHEGIELRNNWLAEKKELVQFFYREITEGKNHSLLSSMSLLKLIQTIDFSKKRMIEKRISCDKDNFETILQNHFVPSALAIALHDSGVWKKLRKEDIKDIPPKILDNIEFEKNPLAFLLIFCDCIQEWGRPTKSHAKQDNKKEEVETRFFLKSMKFDTDQNFTLTLWTPRHSKTEQFFSDKQEEFRDIQFFLKQPSDRKFIIRLEDSNHRGEDYVMEGTTPSVK